VDKTVHFIHLSGSILCLPSGTSPTSKTVSKRQLTEETFTQRLSLINNAKEEAISAKALAAFAKTGLRGGKIGGKALTIKPSEEERQVEGQTAGSETQDIGKPSVKA